MKIKGTILIAFVTMFSCSLLLTGCFEGKLVVRNITNPVPVIQEKVIPTPEPEKKEFSYLDQLPNEKVKAYKEFVSGKDIRHLQTFTPEEILLVYFHSVAMSDVDVIYALTYDNGVLPDVDTFREDYYANLEKREQDVAIGYRYYDSIKAHEGTIKENEIVMVITVTLGIFTTSTAYELKKENNVWKMNIYHLMEYFKSETKK